MLKYRIIGVLLIKNGLLVQSISFKRYLPVGSPVIAAEFLNKWGIDDIILLEIDARKNNQGPNIEVLRKVSKVCFVPVTIGGGIKSVDQIRNLIKNGADKISLNTETVYNPKLVKEASTILGSQSVVVSIDVKRQDSSYKVFIDSGKTMVDIHPVDHARKMEELGAGEILLNSIDNDGSKNGFDYKLIQEVCRNVSIPVIACGGAGHPQHFLNCVKKGGTTAIAAANYFHFSEHSPIITKSFLKKNGIDVRINTQATYENSNYSHNGRINKHSDNYLNKIRFVYEHEEKI